MKNFNFIASILILLPMVFLSPVSSFAKTADLNPPVLKSLDMNSALESLKVGNERFVSGKTRQNGQSLNDIARLASGQAPNSIVFSCSDSRLPPEAVFDQKLGEMFTVRTAGETLSPQAIGSIEYGVEKLGIHLVVVLGHTNCGAVKAACETLNGASLGSENLDQLVQDIHPRIRTALKDSKPSKDFRNESLANAKGVAADLLQRSKLIAAAVKLGKAKIVVGLYDLSSGKVEFKSL